MFLAIDCAFRPSFKKIKWVDQKFLMKKGQFFPFWSSLPFLWLKRDYISEIERHYSSSFTKGVTLQNFKKIEWMVAEIYSIGRTNEHALKHKYTSKNWGGG